MGLNVVRVVEKNHKGFFRYVEQKRQAEESVPLINEKGELATTDMEKAEVLNEFFDSVFTASQASHTSCL